MVDRHNHDRMNRDSPLADALCMLPASAPPHDAWPLLAARARRRHRLRRSVHAALPVALAAGIALALWLPNRAPQVAAPAAPHITRTASTHPDTPRLAQLQARSQRLQTWIEQLDAGSAPLDGSALARVIALQDQIGFVDLQLGAAHDSQTQVPLWHRRIALLEQLAVLRLGAAPGYANASDNHAPTARNAVWTQ